mmetsp:Transcript_7287/g.20691  ORF Transcript_7287/g.20691 Transcript_7287/m.20691 type:complete len:234 (-) Transcript_7287:225-926(-)
MAPAAPLNRLLRRLRYVGADARGGSSDIDGVVILGFPAPRNTSPGTHLGGAPFRAARAGSCRMLRSFGARKDIEICGFRVAPGRMPGCKSLLALCPCSLVLPEQLQLVLRDLAIDSAKRAPLLLVRMDRAELATPRPGAAALAAGAARPSSRRAQVADEVSRREGCGGRAAPVHLDAQAEQGLCSRRKLLCEEASPPRRRQPRGGEFYLSRLVLGRQRARLKAGSSRAGRASG